MTSIRSGEWRDSTSSGDAFDIISLSEFEDGGEFNAETDERQRNEEPRDEEEDWELVDAQPEAHGEVVTEQPSPRPAPQLLSHVTDAATNAARLGSRKEELKAFYLHRARLSETRSKLYRAARITATGGAPPALRPQEPVLVNPASYRADVERRDVATREESTRKAQAQLRDFYAQRTAEKQQRAARNRAAESQLTATQRGRGMFRVQTGQAAHWFNMSSSTSTRRPEPEIGPIPTQVI